MIFLSQRQQEECYIVVILLSMNIEYGYKNKTLQGMLKYSNLNTAKKYFTHNAIYIC